MWCEVKPKTKEELIEGILEHSEYGGVQAIHWTLEGPSSDCGVQRWY